MYEELYRYFILQKKLALPGVGTLELERKPAEGDFVNKRINPPAYAVVLQSSMDAPSFHFYKWLAEALHLSYPEAIIRFNDFIFDLKKQVAGGVKIEWNGIGTLTRGLGGEIKFFPAPESVPGQPVPAEKVIREKAEHMVRVGEDQKTSAEMTEMLTGKKTKKSSWWITALISILLALGFMGWYFYEHGINVSTTANTMKFVPINQSEHYETLQ